MKLLKKTGALAAGIAIVSMVTVAGCGKTATPQERVQSAFDQLSDEMQAYNTSFADEIGLDQLEDYIDNNLVHSNINLSMTIPDNDDIGNVSLTLDAINNIPDKEFDVGIDVGAYGISIPIGNVIYSDEKLYIKSASIFGSDAYSINCNDFVNEFNNSAWASLLGTQIPEASIDTSEVVEQIDVSDWKEAFGVFTSDVKNISSYSLLKDSKNFDLDGKSTSCTGVEILIDKVGLHELIVEYADAIAEGMNETLEGYLSQGVIDSYDADDFNEVLEDIKDMELVDDCKIDVYLDSKGRMINASTPSDIEFTNGSSISFDINFSGTDRRADVIDGKIYVKAGEEISCFTITRNASVSDTEYIENLEMSLETDSSDDVYTVKYINNWNKEDLSFDITFSALENEEEELGLYADGYFADIVKGEACTFKLNNAKLIADGENVLIVSCKILVEPTDSTVEVPSNSIDLLAMSEDDIMSLIYGAMINVSQIGVN